MDQLESSSGSPNDKYSIKNMLFTRAIPVYEIPVPTAGYKVYACIDCGDKFLLESSLKYHIERKSLKISYFCRLCESPKTFFNRCNMLCHIRSHGFKTATINLSDLKIEPIMCPAKRNKQDQNYSGQKPASPVKTQSNENDHRKNCFDCGIELSPPDSSKKNLKSRALHYQKGSKSVRNSCPVCSHVFRTICAFKAHLRIHLSIPPYYCPDCGMYLGSKLEFPFNHLCPSFNMMRAAVRLKCPMPECRLVHPSEYKEHISQNHLRSVFKCNSCYVACFDEKIIQNHIRNAHKETAPLSAYYQCQLCPGKLIVQSQITKHLETHAGATTNAYLCWDCDQYFMSISNLIIHHTEHDNSIRDIYHSILKVEVNHKKIYRVVKKCEQCKRSFTYKCKFEDIEKLPNECPYQCSFSSNTTTELTAQNKELICFMCKDRISQKWEEIKKHFNEKHRSVRCVDVKVNIPIINMEKYINIRKKKKNKRLIPKKGINKARKSKRQNVWKIDNLKNESMKEAPKTDKYYCKKCDGLSINKESLEIHLLSHRDPCTAYQCMECGECFVVKPSFSKHLLIRHSISNVDDYIFQKKCFNEKALNKYQEEPAIIEPLRENQCKICREQFEDSTELEKHFRVHGMAFLLKNNRNNSP